MEALDDLHIFPPTVWMHTKEDRRKGLLSACVPARLCYQTMLTSIRVLTRNKKQCMDDNVLGYAKEVMSLGCGFCEGR